MKNDPKRVLDLGLCRCDICGTVFHKYNGRQKRCSPECAAEGLRRWYKTRKKTYKKRPPREITCIRCGKTFIGMNNQKICLDCLYTRNDCKRYIELRSDATRVGG